MVCLLVADDLTGAADACAKFVARGFSGTVLLTPDAPAAASDDQADVLAINLDTRRLKEPEARRRIRDASRHATSDSRPAVFKQATVFKKIDSTLRGHVGAELDEAMSTFACTHAIVSPAFPAMGRIVRNGHLIVTTSPAGSERVVCDVAGVLASQGVRDVVAMPASGIPKTPPRVLVCDAVSQRDLDHLVSTASDAISAAGGRPLWVGSAGLADAVATHLARSHAPDVPSHAPPLPLPPTLPPTPLPAPVPVAPLPTLSPRGRRVVLFIGSTHPVTREQQRRLLDTGIANVATNAAALRDALNHAGRHVLVAVDWSRTDVRSVHDLLHAADLTGARPAAGAANVAAGAAAGAVAGFVMSGGDTAADICQVMGADRLCLGGEVANGIPWGLLRGGPADGLPLVLKSGGFGGPDALVDAVHFLTGSTF